jgi:hypothetical protein
MDELLRRARIAWAGYAGLGDGFRPGQVRVPGPASVRAAASLGFVSCGSQLSFRLAEAA